VNWFKYATKALLHGALDFSGVPRRRLHHLRGHLMILTYHSFSGARPRGLFGSLPVRQFERHLGFLRDHFELVSLAQGLENIGAGLVRDKPFLALTIDDGFEDNYTLAWPLLKRYGIPATVFLATDFIDSGRPPWPTQIAEILDQTTLNAMSFPFPAQLGGLVEKLSARRELQLHLASLPPAERLLNLEALRAHLRVPEGTNSRGLNWGQIREMHEHGVRFGSHTVFHSYLPSSSDDVVREELRCSKQRIEGELGEPCRLFAFPDGAFDDRSIGAVRAAGFEAAVTQVKGSNVGTTAPYTLHRIEVPCHDPFATFRCRSALAL
jgi:peptidoglycan/xylan/chitin deacetylase (PgdA/CDA1 family)